MEQRGLSKCPLYSSAESRVSRKTAPTHSEGNIGDILGGKGLAQDAQWRAKGWQSIQRSLKEKFSKDVHLNALGWLENLRLHLLPLRPSQPMFFFAFIYGLRTEFLALFQNWLFKDSGI